MKGMSHFVRMPPLALLALAVVCGCHFPGASGGALAARKARRQLPVRLDG